MKFEFATAARIVFGAGSAAQLPSLAAEFGRRALVVTGKDSDRQAGRIAALRAAGIDCSVLATPGEPTVDLVRAGAQQARSEQRQMVIAIGGGSAIDCGKGIAAVATHSGEPLDYLEVVGKAQPFEHAPLPFLAVPTTAGTGSEVTRNAVLGSPAHGVKASLRSPLMLAKVALVDPELTLDLPREVTISTGLDALTQLIEPFVSARANPLVDLYCRDGIERAVRALPRVARDGADREARAEMAFASLLGGLSLANAGLGVVHGFAAPIGGRFDAPHGAVCAAVLPHGIAANIRALRERAPQHPSLARYAWIAQVATGQSHAAPEQAAEWISALCGDLGVPPLRQYGISEADVPGIVADAARASSMKANPIVLTEAELLAIARAAL